MWQLYTYPIHANAHFQTASRDYQLHVIHAFLKQPLPFYFGRKRAVGPHRVCPTATAVPLVIVRNMLKLN